MLHNAQIQQNVSGINNNPLIEFFNSLFQSIEKKNYILIMGPGAAECLQSWNADQPRIHWRIIFEAMISWCVEHNVIEAPNIENEFCELLYQEAWLSLGYLLEEYLTDKAEMQRCLKDVLQNVAQPSNLQLRLIHLPFRGFISTTYDIEIETEYEQVHNQKLAKFYGSSIQDTLDLCQQGQPFLLKLYGDIEHADSLVFGHRWSKGPTCLSNHVLLQSLLSASPVLFYGFNEDDSDYKYLKTLVDEYSPFDELTITISEVIEEQHRDIKPLQVNEIDVCNNLLTCSSSLILSDSVNVPEVNGHVTSYDYYGDSPYHSQTNYNLFTTIQEAPTRDKLGGKGPIEVYTIYTENDAKYYANIQHYVFDVLKNLYNISCLGNEVVRSNEWRRKNYLLTAPLILPLISLSFIASDICKCEQMAQAIKKHHNGDTHIIPILVQPADLWTKTILEDLDALPDNGRAISQWSNKQAAYNNIVNYLERILKQISFG